MRYFWRSLTTILATIVGFSCATPMVLPHSSKPLVERDFSLEKLKLGVAFPPLGNADEIAFSIQACEDLEFDWVRYSEVWNYREPVKDTFSWSAMDERLSALNKANIRVLLTLSGHEWPEWLSSSGSHTEAETLVEFRQYVAALLDRYKGKIARIQYGNEWNWEIDTYLGGDVDAYVKYANIVYEEVYKLPSTERPTVVLGSFSALNYIALDQGLIDKIEIEGLEPYKSQIAAYLVNPDRKTSIRLSRVLAEAKYDMLDIHLYDDFGNWPQYLNAIRSSYRSVKSTSVPIPILVSEFGGPYPKALYSFFGGKPAPEVFSRGLYHYIKTLDSLEIAEAYLFSLTEGDSAREHPDSFLIDQSSVRMPAYSIVKNFSSTNSRL